MATFPLEELYDKLDDSEKRIIERNKRRRERRYRGDFDKHSARILKMHSFCKADEELMWLKTYRPDIPTYKTKILQWQLYIKFDIAKGATWKNLRQLLLPAAGQTVKKTDASHAEICSHLLHVICIEVMGTDRVMNRIREFVRCFDDSELSRFIHPAGQHKKDWTPAYYIGFMLLRPELIESCKDEMIVQMRGSPRKYRGFERICRLMAQLQFCLYNDEQTDVLAETYTREIEDMYVVREKELLLHDFDSVGSCAEYRKNKDKMFGETFPFFKAYCIKRGFGGDTVSSVGDLACVIPSDAMHHPVRRVLTYALLFHRRMVPSIDDRKVMGMWMNEFDWDVDLNGKIAAVKDENFAYHKCFVSLARFVVRFDVKTEGFKRAIAQSGGEMVVKLCALALIYESHHEKALELLDTFLESRPYAESPVLHFIRLQALTKLKKFDVAIGVALSALEHANKMGWTSSITAPFVLRHKYVNEADVEIDMDEYLDDNEDVKNIKSKVYMITEQDTALYTCHLLINIIRSGWTDKETNGSMYYQALIILSQLHFALFGRKLFDQLISEIESKKELRTPSLLGSLKNVFMISTFSRLFVKLIDSPIIVCEEMREKFWTTNEERAKYKKEIIEVFQKAHTRASANAEELIPSIARSIGLHATDIIKGIIVSEGKETVMPTEQIAAKESEMETNVVEAKETNVETVEQSDEPMEE